MTSIAADLLAGVDSMLHRRPRRLRPGVTDPIDPVRRRRRNRDAQDSQSWQTFVDIYTAKDTDFHKATQRVYRTRELPSHVTVQVLP